MALVPSAHAQRATVFLSEKFARGRGKSRTIQFKGGGERLVTTRAITATTQGGGGGGERTSFKGPPKRNPAQEYLCVYAKAF